MQIQNSDAEANRELRTYLGILWRRRWWIVGVAVGVGLLAFLNAIRHDDRYRATAAVLISAPPQATVQIGDRPLSDSAERQMANEIRLVNSRELRAEVIDRIGRTVSVTASNAAGTDVIDLASTNTDPAEAAEDVNDFIDAYITVRRGQTLEDIEAARADVQAERAETRAGLMRLRRTLRSIDAELEGNQDPAEISRLLAARADEAARISDDEHNAISDLDGYDGVLAQLDGLAELASPGIDIISRAQVPASPFYPQPKKDLLVGLTVGLLLGLAVAFVREFADDRILTEDDLERALPDVPLLSIIPELESEASGRLIVGSGTDPSGDIGAEAYRSLAASVEFSQLGKPVTVIHVTSSVAGEGKSTTTANLAIAFAETGTRVVVIDADLRRPSLHRILDAPPGPGLSGYLTRKATLEEALQPVDGVPSLMLLAPGPLPQNPTRLLYARRTEELFDQLRAEFDVIVVDSPPLLPVADSLILAQFADLILFVACAGRTGRRIVRKAHKAATRVDAGAMATVLNRAPRSGPDGYDYYYGRYYRQSAATQDDATPTPDGAPA